MMEVEYRREMNRNYMVVRAENVGNEKYTIRMLSGNQIEGLLAFQDKMVDGEVKYYYDITSKQPLNRVLEHRNMSGRELRAFMAELLYTLREMERFFLDEGQLCLQPDYIYVDPNSFKGNFCLIPGIRKDFGGELCELSQYLLDHVNQSDGEAVVLAFSVFKECRKMNFGIDDIERCLRQQDTAGCEGKGEGKIPDSSCQKDGYQFEKTSVHREIDEDLNWNKYAGTEREWKESTSQNLDENSDWKKKFSLGWGESKEPESKKLVPEETEPAEIPLRNMMAIGIAAGMILVPVIFLMRLGMYGIYQWKWMFVAGEYLAVAALFAVLKSGQQPEAGKSTKTSKSAGHRKSKRKDNVNSQYQGEYDYEYDDKQGENEYEGGYNARYGDKYEDEEPWEVYFREEEHPESTSHRTENSYKNRYQDRKKIDKVEGDYGEIEDEDDNEDDDEIQTVLLNARPIYKECRKLVPVGGGPEIAIGYYPFIIGKNKDLTDYCLNKPGVSRLHIKLEEAGEGYIITDLNSTNGTMVNGVLLEANETASLAPGDELAIAAERYHFR